MWFLSGAMDFCGGSDELAGGQDERDGGTASGAQADGASGVGDEDRYRHAATPACSRARRRRPDRPAGGRRRRRRAGRAASPSTTSTESARPGAPKLCSRSPNWSLQKAGSGVNGESADDAVPARCAATSRPHASPCPRGRTSARPGAARRRSAGWGTGRRRRRRRRRGGPRRAGGCRTAARRRGRGRCRRATPRWRASRRDSTTRSAGSDAAVVEQHAGDRGRRCRRGRPRPGPVTKPSPGRPVVLQQREHRARARRRAAWARPAARRP